MKCSIWNFILISAICTFLFLIIYCNLDSSINRDTVNQNKLDILPYLNGYWISNDVFNNASDIDKMILYIDFENNNSNLVIIINNQIASNEQYDFFIDDNISNIKNISDFITFDIRFISDTNNNIWDDKLFQCNLNIMSGNIKLFHNNTLYADFIKDNAITNIIDNI